MKTLDIYITDVCNLNCDYCYVDIKKKESKSIDSKSFMERVNLLDYDIIKFYGWEPLVKYREILEIVWAVRKRKPKTQFTVLTNWLLLTKKILDLFDTEVISIWISLHREVIQRIFNNKRLSLLSQYRHRIWFFILIEYWKENISYEIIKLLSNAWFTKFTLNPITTDDWIELDNLKKTLLKIYKLFEKNPDLEIEEANWNYIKNLHNSWYCRKTQVDKLGNYKACNRFWYIDFLENPSNIEFIDNIFEKEFSFSKRPDRWFFVCNKWWYIDNFWSSLNYDISKVYNFFNLNLELIWFFRRLAQLRWKVNFLTQGIQEIRFNITNQCNLRCDYCYLDFNNDVINESTAKNIIDFLVSQNWDEKTISFFWWEPLLQFKLIKELTCYAYEAFTNQWKKINFKIATNFLLSNKKIFDFFDKYNYQIHISYNGATLNHATRDGSSNLLFKKITEYINIWYNLERITLLYVIFPHGISNIENDLIKIQDIWFLNIHLEMYIWQKYTWNKNTYKMLFYTLGDIILKNKLQSVCIDNIHKTSFNEVYLDIATSWRSNDNSLEFFNEKLDFSPKKNLDNFLTHVIPR